MMGRLEHEQAQLFYSFRLDEAVPADHPVRGISGVLDLPWVMANWHIIPRLVGPRLIRC
jgi:hypothetical protein